MTPAPASPVVAPVTASTFLRAKAAKAAGQHAAAVVLLKGIMVKDPDFASAARMLQVIEQYPNQQFTYTRVLDFIFSKGWGIYDCFFTTERLICRYGLKTGVELGVSHGFHAQHLLEACPNLELVGVDAYRHIRHGGGYDHISEEQFDDTCRKARGYLVPTSRWRLMQMTTAQAAKIFRGPADFLFIDADHSYDAVRQDIRDWFDFVRSGGIVAGHDYGQPMWPGVKQAVDEVLAGWGLKANVGLGTVWWVQKP